MGDYVVRDERGQTRAFDNPSDAFEHAVTITTVEDMTMVRFPDGAEFTMLRRPPTVR